MPRGHFWEMCYDPDADAPTDVACLENLKSVTGFCECRIEAKNGQASVKLRMTSGAKHFDRCDFVLKVVNSDFVNCTFTQCRFNGSAWEGVKFSNCTFQQCHFGDTSFVRCYFLDTCRFDEISASAEKLRMEETAISPSAFLGAIETNLTSLTDKKHVAYQRYRLVGTKAKIAGIVFNSTRSEPDLDFFFDAHKQLALHSLNQKIEHFRYKNDGSWKTATPSRWFVLLSFLNRLEKWIVLTGGFLTDWGRSLLRALLFFAAVFSVFTAVYFFEPPDVISSDSKSAARPLTMEKDKLLPASNRSVLFLIWPSVFSFTPPFPTALPVSLTPHQETDAEKGNSIADAAPRPSRLERLKTSAVASLEISLVAGYTAQVTPEMSFTRRWTRLANLLLGVYWYSLLIPVLSRRTLR